MNKESSNDEAREAELDSLRSQIDIIDGDLVELLNKRAELVLSVKAKKSAGKLDIYSPARERQILDKVIERAKGGSFPTQSLERIFTHIVSATRSLIGELQVSYVGPEYSLGFDAALKQFGDDVHYVSEPSIEEVFAKVERQKVHFGVVPVRNAQQGMIEPTFDLLLHSSLKIIAELEIRERLHLFGHAENTSEVNCVYADSYNFSRTEAWLRAHLPAAKLVVEYALPNAVERVRSEERSALIALEVAGERFSLPEVARGIEQDNGADARFFVLGTTTPLPTGSDKTSLLCGVAEKAGALRALLEPFSRRGLSLLKIDSRPTRNKAWEYVFFIEIAGHTSEPAVQACLKELETLCTYVRVVGSYPLVCQS